MRSNANTYRSLSHAPRGAAFVAAALLLGNCGSRSCTGSRPPEYGVEAGDAAAVAVPRASVLREDRPTPLLVPQHFVSMSTVKFNPEGSVLATIDSIPESTLILWDAKTLAPRGFLPLKTHPQAIAWHPTSADIAVTKEGMVEILDAATLGTRVAVRSHPTHLEFARKGSVLLTLTANQIESWNPADGTRVAQATLEQPGIELASAPDQEVVVIAEEKGWSVRDANTLAEQRRIPLKYRATGTAFSPDGKTLALSSIDNGIELWDPATWQIRKSLRDTEKGRRDGPIAWSRDGRFLIAGNEDGAIRVWDTGTGTVQAQLKSLKRACSFGKMLTTGASHAVAATDGAQDQQVYFWTDPGSKPMLLGKVAGAALAGIAWPHDGKGLLAPTQAGELVRIASGEGLVQRIALAGALDWIVSNPSQPAALLWAVDEQTGYLVYWDAATQRELWKRPYGRYANPVAAFSHDGTRVALGVGQSVEIVATATGSTLQQVSFPENPFSLALNSEPARLIVALSKSFRVVDTATGKSLREVACTAGHTSSLALEPSTAQVALGFSDGTIRIETESEGRLIASLSTEGRAPQTLAWSAGGRRLAVGAAELTRVWARPSGQLLLEHRGSHVRALTWSPEGAFLAVADDPPYLWRASDGAVLWIRLPAGLGKQAYVVTKAGTFDGPEETLDSEWFRLGTNVVASPVASARSLAGQYRRPGLLGLFLSGGNVD